MTERAPILVFDLDGTLADTAGDLIATLNVLLAREGLPAVAARGGPRLVGAGARALIERGFALNGAPLAARAGRSAGAGFSRPLRGPYRR